jgi:hypothetical protein
MVGCPCDNRTARCVPPPFVVFFAALHGLLAEFVSLFACMAVALTHVHVGNVLFQTANVMRAHISF